MNQLLRLASGVSKRRRPKRWAYEFTAKVEW